jgi:hypothetical protein
MMRPERRADRAQSLRSSNDMAKTTVKTKDKASG